MSVVNGSFVNEHPISVAAGTTYDIRPAEGEEVSLHYVLHTGKGKVNYYDGSTLGTEIATSQIGNSVNGQAVRLTYGKYARFTSLEASATQLLDYSGAYVVVPAV